MIAYRFVPHDQSCFNWILFRELKKSPYLEIKESRLRLFCPSCEKFDHDRAFQENFEDGIRIRSHARNNIVITDDGFWLFDDKLLELIESHGYKGIKTKQLPGTKWHIVNITERRKGDPTTYKRHGHPCGICGRHEAITGLTDYESQIEIPSRSGRFFTNDYDLEGSGHHDKELFVTEDIVETFRGAGIKGGEFMRFLNSDEEKQMRESLAKTNQRKWPKGVRISL